MDEALGELGEYIAAALGAEVSEAAVEVGELSVRAQGEDIVKVLTFLREDSSCQFRLLMDICAVDYPERPHRFEVVYSLLSLKHNQRIRVKVANDGVAAVPSATGVFGCAGWFEREAWDLYGVFFSGHPDLRRLLTDYGFEGHPLRKDFPLSGHVEMRYDEEAKRVVYEPVSLTQEFRRFDFMSPWEGTEYAPSQDDKAEN